MSEAKTHDHAFRAKCTKCTKYTHFICIRAFRGTSNGNFDVYKSTRLSVDDLDMLIGADLPLFDERPDPLDEQCVLYENETLESAHIRRTDIWKKSRTKPEISYSTPIILVKVYAATKQSPELIQQSKHPLYIERAYNYVRKVQYRRLWNIVTGRPISRQWIYAIRDLVRFACEQYQVSGDAEHIMRIINALLGHECSFVTKCTTEILFPCMKPIFTHIRKGFRIKKM